MHYTIAHLPSSGITCNKGSAPKTRAVPWLTNLVTCIWLWRSAFNLGQTVHFVTPRVSVSHCDLNESKTGFTKNEGSCRRNEVFKTCGTEIKASFAEGAHVHWAIISEVFHVAKKKGGGIYSIREMEYERHRGECKALPLERIILCWNKSVRGWDRNSEPHYITSSQPNLEFKTCAGGK